jgi:ATP-dependent Clp protease ATP-binding subunit ClpC
MDARFSQRIKDVLSYSKEEAIRLGNAHISTEHLFLGILRDGEGLAIDILILMGAELYDLRRSIEELIRPESAIKVNDTDNIPLLKSAEKVLKLVYLEAKSLQDDTIDTGHLLLAIMKDENSIATQVLKEHNIDYDSVRLELESTKKGTARSEFPGDEDDEDEGKGPYEGGSKGSGSGQQASKSSSETPVLDNFGIDLTKAAEEDRLDPIVGRESLALGNLPSLRGWQTVTYSVKFRGYCSGNGWLPSILPALSQVQNTVASSRKG